MSNRISIKKHCDFSRPLFGYSILTYSSEQSIRKDHIVDLFQEQGRENSLPVVMILAFNSWANSDYLLADKFLDSFDDHS